MPSNFWLIYASLTSQWNHNECDSFSNHQRLHCLLNRLFRFRSKKTSKLCLNGLCEGNSQVTGEFPIQKASNMENVSIWWHHHEQNGHHSTDNIFKCILLNKNAWILNWIRLMFITYHVNWLAPSHQLNSSSLIVNWILSNKLRWNKKIWFSFTKMHSRRSFAKYQPLYLGLNALNNLILSTITAIIWKRYNLTAQTSQDNLLFVAEVWLTSRLSVS